MYEKFTRNDLKDGMVVELRGGGLRLAISGNLAGPNSHFLVGELQYDLTHNRYSNLDIVKIYRVKAVIRTVNDIFQKDFLELIWERKETKCMTVEEMKAKLEELTGEKIEVEYKADRFEMIGELYCYCDSINGYCGGCKLKSVHEKYGCNFENHPEETLKQCYEKVIEECQD